jgi:protein arginine N-methyltransferase 1
MLSNLSDYSLSEYGNMIADKTRMDPYAYALKAAITPDSIVLDIGAATGIHALLACKFGARQVYAIEPSEAIHLAREVARINGFAERIQLIQGLSSHFSLPEPADIIVSDLRGALPLFGQHIPSIVDARQRHLAAGGQLIPRRDTLWAALVEARNVYRDLIEPWQSPYGLDMALVKQLVLNSWDTTGTETIRPRNLLTEAQLWATLDYDSIEDPNVAKSNMVYEARRDGTAHGWLLWFDAELTEDIGFSNGPGADRIAEVYGRAFFPLLEPIPVVAGDSINLSIEAKLVGQEYIWRWHTRFLSPAEPGGLKTEFDQSSANDDSLSTGQLSEHITNSRPSLGLDGEIDHFILGKMNGRTTVKEIVKQLQVRFPAHLQDEPEAIRYVYEIGRQYKR